MSEKNMEGEGAGAALILHQGLGGQKCPAGSEGCKGAGTFGCLVLLDGLGLGGKGQHLRTAATPYTRAHKHTHNASE